MNLLFCSLIVRYIWRPWVAGRLLAHNSRLVIEYYNTRLLTANRSYVPPPLTKQRAKWLEMCWEQRPNS